MMWSEPNLTHSLPVIQMLSTIRERRTQAFFIGKFNIYIEYM